MSRVRTVTGSGVGAHICNNIWAVHGRQGLGHLDGCLHGIVCLEPLQGLHHKVHLPLLVQLDEHPGNDIRPPQPAWPHSACGRPLYEPLQSLLRAINWMLGKFTVSLRSTLRVLR